MTIVDQHRQTRFLSSSSSLFVYFAVGALATLFDAYSSYLIIEVNPIALEGNPIWGSLGDSIGFGNAMIVRAIVGVVALSILLFMANRQPQANGAVAKGRTAARFGIRFAAGVLLVLCAWHIFGSMYFS